jgi:hypothetical protein
VWGRELNGLVLTFHLAGINNQNFLMQDDQTGTFWQQISGLAISGPLAGQSLRRIPSDELTFSLWKSEQPQGTVLQDVRAFAKEYSPRDWDVKMKKRPTVITHAGKGIADRDLMYGIRAFGESKAYPAALLLRDKLIPDRIGPEPIILLVGPDNQSARAFHARIAGVEALPDFYRTGTDMIDSVTGSHWNFQGCATEGKAKSTCLEPIQLIADYWFDWRQYNPKTTVYHDKLNDSPN